MVPGSPAEALGHHADLVRKEVIETVRDRHGQATEAHRASGSRYNNGFGTQWRDLLDDVYEALKAHGYQPYKALGSSQSLPIVNDCLVCVWRRSGDPSHFASSPRRERYFNVPPADPALFNLAEATDEEKILNLQSSIRELPEVMPVVLVIVDSVPNHLRSIKWAVAELDKETEQVKLCGGEDIWLPETVSTPAAPKGDSFDSGTPTSPEIKPRTQERPQLDE